MCCDSTIMKLYMVEMERIYREYYTGYREGCTISTPCTIPSSVYYTLYYHKVHTVLPYSTPCTIQNPVLYRDLYSTGPARVTLAGL